MMLAKSVISNRLLVKKFGVASTKASFKTFKGNDGVDRYKPNIFCKLDPKYE
jgi:hypothetical protein